MTSPTNTSSSTPRAQNANVCNYHCNKLNESPSASDQLVDASIDNTRVWKLQALIYPQLLLEEIPLTQRSKATVTNSRVEIVKIVQGRDDRLLVVVGPCSIHDPAAAFEYARKLKIECQRLIADLRVVMRVYFEKPRTTVGWKGFINDPDLDSTFHVNKGLRIGRRLLADITGLGVPVGCEYLDTMLPQYTADLVSWSAIGARTTECQLHRELASGLSMPVGFKNGTGGDVQIAVDACFSVRHPHAFLGITKQGLPAICHSTGNPDCHVVLRGGVTNTNYSEKHVEAAVSQLQKAGCCPRLVIDFSHGNAQKDHRQQPVVCKDVCRQIAQGSKNIMGVMLESHLYEGNQPLPPSSPRHELKKDSDSNLRLKAFSMTQDTKVLSQLRYGVSVTDKCVSWSETILMLDELAAAVRQRRLIGLS